MIKRYANLPILAGCRYYMPCDCRRMAYNVAKATALTTLGGTTDLCERFITAQATVCLAQ